ncbi:MAG: hypothetical protein PHW95_05585 [Patescibacteria group bacterium]|nr:hypothetical protein [Patescibacteria group bacterium]
MKKIFCFCCLIITGLELLSFIAFKINDWLLGFNWPHPSWWYVFFVLPVLIFLTVVDDEPSATPRQIGQSQADNEQIDNLVADLECAHSHNNWQRYTEIGRELKDAGYSDAVFGLNSGDGGAIVLAVIISIITSWSYIEFLIAHFS